MANPTTHVRHTYTESIAANQLNYNIQATGIDWSTLSITTKGKHT